MVLPGAGPVNRSMGGAGTATALDATGALFWNAAAISALDRPQIDFAVELLFPQATLQSSVRPNSFGLGIPPVGLAGSTDSDSGVAPLPSFGLVWRPEDSCWTYGLGVFVVGGFSANYPGSPHNPVLSPPPPAGIGLG